MPIKLRTLSIVLVIAGIISAPALAATAPDQSTDFLLRGAKKWAAKDRPDLAKNLLQKLILIEPNSQEALFMLGNIELTAGNHAEARVYLNALEKTAPNGALTQELSASYRLATTDRNQLEDMRSLAQAGKTAEAQKLLMQMFPGKPPRGEMGVEYYRLLGSTKAGFIRAQNELPALYKETGDSRYRLIQHELQANHPEHLSSAIRGYEELSKSANVNTQRLQDNWRRDLYRYPDNANKLTAIRNFLSAYPNDREMIELLGDSQKNIAAQRLAPKPATLAAIDNTPAKPQKIAPTETKSTQVQKTAPTINKVAPKPTPSEKIVASVPKVTATKPAIKQPRAAGKAPVIVEQPIVNPPKIVEPVLVKQPVAAEPVVVEIISKPVDPDIVARSEALDALEDGNLELAATSLTALLKRRPQDPEILGGLGMIKLRQGKQAEAEDWFKQALRVSDEDGIGKWTSLVTTAGFWKNIRLADELLEENQLRGAEAAIQQALLLQPEDPHALALLGNIKAADNDLVEAERLYRQVLSKEGYNVAAIRGLTSLLTRTQRSAEALELLERVFQTYPDELNQNPENHAGLLREEADLYIAAHRPSHAVQALEMALVLAPRNAWVRFSLAKLYVSLNLTPLAIQVLQEGAALSPKDPDMHYVRALVLISLNDYAGGLDSLAKIPDAEMTKSMRETWNRALIQYHFQQAESMLAQGNRKEAIRIMSIVETQARNNYSATEQVAEGWFGLDLQKQGLSAMRKLPQPVPLGTQVYFASLLNRAKQDQELAAYLPSLRIPEGTDVTTRKYQTTLQDIEFAMAGRQFDKLMKAGKIEQAQQLADTVLNTGQLSNADYFKYHRTYFARSELPENAIPLLEQEKALYPNDLSIRWDLAYAYYQAKQNPQAQGEIQELLALTTGDDIDMRLRVARLQQNMGDHAGAKLTINDLLNRFPENTDVLMQAGNIARSEGKYNRAMNYYQKTQEQAQKPVVAETKAVKLVEQDTDVLLDLLPAQRMATGSRISKTSRVAPALASTKESDKIYRSALASDVATKKYVANSAATVAEQEMESIASRRSAKIEAGLDIQSKTASSGTSTYNATEIPLRARFPIGYEAHGTVQVDLVNIDAGTLPSAYNDSALFGQIQAYGFPTQPIPQKATGTSIGFGYEQESVKADIGVVGIGFPVSNVVGGLRKGGDVGRLSYSLTLSRRPHTGSLLSYAGAKDPATNTTWGGVTNTGLTLYMSTTLKDFNVSTMASYGLLRGKNVLNNDRLYLRAALDQDVYSTDDMILNVGLNANYTRHSENQAYYTYGHGGYYSPQSSLSFSLPIELIGREDLLSYQIRLNLSYSRSNEDAAVFYPTDPGLQALAAAAAAGGLFPKGYPQAIYGGGTGGGYGYGVRAATEYRLTPNFALGGRFNMERSAYYAPNSLLFYLRYMFSPETGQVKMRPDPVTPYSQY
ncbi:MAG: cellulose synthase subunit BcsC-related outer membrane protein [Gallionella sp.]|nr:cellulose synthase subunit BcsC-related outer membrane protein [Gallionella sp.]